MSDFNKIAECVMGGDKPGAILAMLEVAQKQLELQRRQALALEKIAKAIERHAGAEG